MNIETKPTPALKAKDAPDLGAFDWMDALRLDDQLEEDERMIAASARSYAQEKLQQRVTAAYAGETTLWQSIRAIAGARGLALRLVACEPLPTGDADRKTLARQARQAICEALGQPDDAPELPALGKAA